MKIAIGSDHAGFELKQAVINHLESKNIEVTDVGTFTKESVHYPIFGQLVGNAVVNGAADFGIAICGTGVGIGIAANKVKGIRAAIVSDTFSARMSRLHNDANVLAFGARVVGVGLALDIVDAFLNGTFEGGRHKTRVDLISQIDVGEDITSLA